MKQNYEWLVHETKNFADLNSDWKYPTEFPALRNADMVALDTETFDPGLIESGPGWTRREGHVAGISVAAQFGNDIFSGYYPIGHKVHGEEGNIDKKQVTDWLQQELKHNNNKVFANASYDLGWLSTENIQVGGLIEDVQIMAPLIDENLWSYSLDSLCKLYLKEAKDETLLNKAINHYGLKHPKAEMYKLPPQFVGPYAIQDAILTLKLYKHFNPLIDEDLLSGKSLRQVYDLETKLIPILFKMQQRGIRVDIGRAEIVKEEFTKQIKEKQKWLNSQAGFELNVNSGDDLGRACDKLGINDYPITEKTKKPSFVKEFLEIHPSSFLRTVRDVRKMMKANSTFIEGAVLNKVHNGRIYPQFHQLRREEDRSGKKSGTISGRFSCIAKGTKIMLPGEEKNIEDIKLGDLVYCYDNIGNLKLSKVKNVFNNGIQKCLKIIWQSSGSGKIGELICTPEHLIKTKYKGWVKVQNLKRWDKLFHLHKSGTKRIKLTGTNLFEDTEEGFIKKEYFKVPSNYHIHHIDENKLNNQIKNLQVMTGKEYRSYHGKKRALEGKIKISHLRLPQNRGRILRKEEKWNYKKFTQEQLEQMLHEAKGRITKLPIPFETFKNKCIDLNFDFKPIAVQYTKRYNILTKEIVLASIHKHNGVMSKVIKELNVGIYALKKFCLKNEITYNHMVQNIVSSIEHEVYDLEIENHHNFIANEICVHNCTNPNLQQVSSRDKVVAPLIKQIFLPEEDTLWGSYDYASQEPRWTVHKACELYRANVPSYWLEHLGSAENAAIKYNIDPNTDYHQMVADLCNIDRRSAKTINLGLAYGMGGAKLCRSLRLETEFRLMFGKMIEMAGQEGQVILDKYNSGAAYIKGLSKFCDKFVQDNGYIRTHYGRHARFNKWVSKDFDTARGMIPKSFEDMRAAINDPENSLYGHRMARANTYIAMNRLIQGSSADQTKLAMLLVSEAGYLPLATIHDELAIPISLNNKDKEIKEIKDIMENCMPLIVPSKVDVGIGLNWGLAKT